jgi:chlorobactene glucosyltransferase
VTAWLLVLPALVPLGLTLLNLATWSRPRPLGVGRVAPTVSALVPARNEEQTIELCVRALLRQARVTEVVVYNDGSIDATGAILARLQGEDPRLRVLDGVPLPEGWVGKPHACHRLAQSARGERLLFVDADTELAPDGLDRLLTVGADLTSALPRERVGSLGEALIVSLLHLTYLSWLPLELIRWVRDPRVLAANGQVLLVDRAAYERLGGFEAVRAEVVDDMALCRAAKQAGLTVAFVDGFHVASCRMYTSGRQAVDGFSKNLYEGVGHPLALALVVAMYLACFVLPWALLPLAPVAAAAGIGANLLQRSLIAHRYRLPASTVALHLVSVALFVWIAWRSFGWSRGDRIQWRGRTYAAKARRTPVAANTPARSAP